MLNSLCRIIALKPIDASKINKTIIYILTSSNYMILYFNFIMKFFTTKFLAIVNHTLQAICILKGRFYCITILLKIIKKFQEIKNSKL
jgi:hypothetical protein